MKELFDLLYQQLWTPKHCNKIIATMSDDKIYAVIDSAISIIQRSNSIKHDSKFSFVANNTLSGGTFPCSRDLCRINHIDTLARNAALYADVVYIQNPFEKYLHTAYFSDYAKALLIADIKVLYHVKPLLDAGIFLFTTTFQHICRDCLRETKAITKEYEAKIIEAEISLKETFLNEIEFILETDEDGDAFIIAEGPEEILEHPSGFSYTGNALVDLRKKLGRKTQGVLTKRQATKLGLINEFVHPIIDDLLTQNYYSNIYNSSYLTDREIDSTLIQDKNKSILNKKFTSSLSHHIPHIPNVPLDNLINLRKKEGEAFQVYRDSLTNFLSNSKENDTNLKEAFRDEILPEINKMNQSIKSAKKIIVADLVKDIIVGTTFVSIGLFSHFLPENIGQIVAGLGGINYLSKFGDNTKKLTNIESEIRNNKYFFVWKLRQG
ncbi:hypothetical protein [Hymenobacter sublimis]|uniref:Uncharacterized protein n=1 Tax=Hymenobacter sublimis TaxID=2933777 RepID=A0ABY4JFM8_9BACT|nr:hypothetical protein [Hymenobacter sublimis]UPL50808.1 hypothetical protein MWH26_07860 [Hymenobacter sublimis]